jgi:hypothetical protein
MIIRETHKNFDNDGSLCRDGSNTKDWIQYSAYALWGLSALFLLFVLCMYNSIKIATAVMKTSAVFLS